MEKADSLSIQGQIDLCSRKVDGQFQVYEDRGYSGKNTNRPGFQKMMEDVERGIIQKIVVYRLDRFSRSIADFSRLWEILQKHGVEFVSLNETFDTATPMGRAMLNIIMIFAQLERETTAQRVRDNYRQRAKLGCWPGGPPPYGFSLDKLPGADGRPVPGLVPGEQAALVREIFCHYAGEGATLGSTADWLNRRQIPGPKRAVWDNVSLSRLLHNPVYVMADEEVSLYYQAKGVEITTPLEAFDGRHGALLIGKRDRSGGVCRGEKEQRLSLANHRGLIPAEIWLACQHKLDANRQLGGRGRGKHTWLSGLLKCACCGYSVKVNRDGDKYYLICSGRSNLKVCRSSIRVDLRELETGVAGELEKLLARCPGVEKAVEEQGETARELADIDQKIQRLMMALTESSALSMTYINRTIETLEARRQQLLREETRRRSRPKPRPEPLHFAGLSFEEKKLVAAHMIREIRLEGDTAQVLWNV